MLLIVSLFCFNCDQCISFVFKHHENASLILLEKMEDGDAINVANSEQKMPIHIAAKNGLVSVVQLLLSKGANLTATDGSGKLCVFLSFLENYGHEYGSM